MPAQLPQRGMMSDINVTPLVDVMLVLLVIFMISASLETMQVKYEKQQMEEMILKQEKGEQQVKVNMPKTDSEPVNLAEEKKLVMSIDENANFYIGETRILACLDLAPELKKVLGAKRGAWGEEEDKGFKKCLDALGKKLGANEKLKSDKELYLRADRNIPYALVLKVMAKIRSLGVMKFGLVAEPEEG